MYKLTLRVLRSPEVHGWSKWWVVGCVIKHPGWLWPKRQVHATYGSNFWPSTWCSLAVKTQEALASQQVFDDVILSVPSYLDWLCKIQCPKRDVVQSGSVVRSTKLSQEKWQFMWSDRRMMNIIEERWQFCQFMAIFRHFPSDRLSLSQSDVGSAGPWVHCHPLQAHPTSHTSGLALLTFYYIHHSTLWPYIPV